MNNFFDNKYPYTDMHELNASFLIENAKDTKATREAAEAAASEAEDAKNVAIEAKNEVFEVRDLLQSKIQQIDSNTARITNEVTRAEQNENVINNKLTDEITRSKREDASIKNLLEEETTRAKRAEAFLTSDIQNETRRAKREEARIENLFKLPTQEAVNAWLDLHPEATTTVEDNSLTINKMVNGTLGFVTPESYGATGDGVADDTTAIQSAIDSGYNVMFNNTYKITEQINVTTNNITLYGHGTIVYYYDHLNTTDIKKAVNISADNVTIYDITITSDFSTNDDFSLNVVPLYYANVYGLWFSNSNNCIVSAVTLSMFTDGSHVNDSVEINFYNIVSKNIGQEHIVFENCVSCSVNNSEFYWHLGDGIIVKHYDEERMSGFTLANNYFHDGKTGYIQLLTQETFWCGGGFTVNCEGHDTVLNNTSGVICKGNRFINTNYGIILANVVNAIVDGNLAYQYKDAQRGFLQSQVIGLDYSSINNPDVMNYTDIKIINNTILQGNYGIRCIDNGAITVHDVVISGNYISNCNSIGLEAHHAIVTANTFINCKHLLFSKDCVISENKFFNTTITTLTGRASDEYAIRLTGYNKFINNIVDTNAYLYCEQMYGNVDDNKLKIIDTVTSAWIIVLPSNNILTINNNDITGSAPFYTTSSDKVIFNNKNILSNLYTNGGIKYLVKKSVELTYASNTALSATIDYSNCGFTSTPCIIITPNNIGYSSTKYFNAILSSAGANTNTTSIRLYSSTANFNGSDSTTVDVIIFGV